MTRVYDVHTFRIRLAKEKTDSFIELPMQTHRNGGFKIESFDYDCVFPEIGEATFTCPYGRLSKGLKAKPDDYAQHHVIIEKNTGTEAAPSWRVEFWGYILASEDIALPGSVDAEGMVRYHAKCGLWQLTTGRMDKHKYKLYNQDTYTISGHPGYNAADDNGNVLGNQSTTESGSFDTP